MFQGKAAAGLVLILAGYAGWTQLRNHEDRACQRVADLCEYSEPQTAQCIERLQRLGKRAGDGPVADTVKCIAEANSCAQGKGCMVGGAIRGWGLRFRDGLDGALGPVED